MKILNYLCILLYYLIRPLLGPAQCRFSVSCGDYAIQQLQEQSLIPALKAIFKRVWSCAPWPARCSRQKNTDPISTTKIQDTERVSKDKGS